MFDKKHNELQKKRNLVQEHANAQGRGLALANTGAVYNLTNYSMGDGARTWNDEASSTIVKSN
ncbi:hypothetical protein [Bacillus toyonensis]|uniref:hypothetical protein n=1 Tax=Bacillus toyonensis TaxID=155322 RepID=UPI0024064C21|nr:hypothetical protein [Bacillus toyonensis]MDF9450238.1 hypothetical protein [Bacillus toyonensis]MDG1564554.1 hypothetical protein [Bacillus toyonensis]